MRDNIFKKLIRALWLRSNSIQRILFGPMRGMFFRINAITGLAPVYSGAERKHQSFFREFLQEGMVVIDVGASWGLHTLYVSKLVGETGKVIAIEPFPSAFKELRWHVEKNNSFNVMPLKYAVSDKDGKIMLFSTPFANGFFLPPETQRASFDKYEAQAKKLDTIAGDLSLQRVDLIKLDVEGSESEVLRGAERIISEHKPYFIIELHYYRHSGDDAPIDAWFSKRGYALKKFSPIKRSAVWLLASPR